MRAWIFPILIIFIVIVSLSLIYFNPELIAKPKLLSPLAEDWSGSSSITPTKNPLAKISTPMPVPLDSTKPTAKAVSDSITSITLTSEKLSTGSAKLLWTIDGQAKQGFAVLQSTASAPILPPRLGDKVQLVSDPTAREITLTDLPNSTFIRLCELVNNSCGTFSNQISLEF